MSKSSTTFPTRIERLQHKMPHAYANNGIEEEHIDFVAPPANQPFHMEKMRQMKEQVLARSRVNRFNETNYLLGGSRQLYMRDPQPQGSFLRPLSLSGSISYGDNSLKGGFRTREGQELGIKLLQERGRQFEMLSQAEEQGQTLIPVQAPKVETDDPDVLAAELLLDQITSATNSGLATVGELSAAELRKFYAILKKIALKLDQQQLESYLERLRETTINLEAMFGTAVDAFEGGVGSITKLTQIAFTLKIVKMCYFVIRLAFSTIRIEAKRRKALFNSGEKAIRLQLLPSGASRIQLRTVDDIESARRKLEEVDGVFDDLLQKIAQEPKAEATAQFALTDATPLRPQAQPDRDAPLQGGDEDGQFAPGGMAAPQFAPEFGQYDPYGETYAIYDTQDTDF